MITVALIPLQSKFMYS